MIIAEAAENYLEAIFMLHNSLGRVRSIDICTHLGISKPTVSVMMKQFRENGYIEMDADGFITLTEKGAEIAGAVSERHNLLAAILINLGVDEKTAYADACKIEHDLSRQSFDCIKTYYNKQIKT